MDSCPHVIGVVRDGGLVPAASDKRAVKRTHVIYAVDRGFLCGFCNDVQSCLDFEIIRTPRRVECARDCPRVRTRGRNDVICRSCKIQSVCVAVVELRCARDYPLTDNTTDVVDARNSRAHEIVGIGLSAAHICVGCVVKHLRAACVADKTAHEVLTYDRSTADVARKGAIVNYTAFHVAYESADVIVADDLLAVVAVIRIRRAAHVQIIEIRAFDIAEKTDIIG